MTEQIQVRIRMTDDYLASLKAMHRQTYPLHGLSFNSWELAMLEAGIAATYRVKKEAS